MGLWEWLFGTHARRAAPRHVRKPKKQKRKTTGGVGGALGKVSKLAHTKVGKAVIIAGASASGGPAGGVGAAAALQATEGQGY